MDVMKEMKQLTRIIIYILESRIRYDSTVHNGWSWNDIKKSKLYGMGIDLEICRLTRLRELFFLPCH